MKLVQLGNIARVTALELVNLSQLIILMCHLSSLSRAYSTITIPRQVKIRTLSNRKLLTSIEYILFYFPWICYSNCSLWNILRLKIHKPKAKQNHMPLMRICWRWLLNPTRWYIKLVLALQADPNCEATKACKFAKVFAKENVLIWLK